MLFLVLFIWLFSFVCGIVFLMCPRFTSFHSNVHPKYKLLRHNDLRAGEFSVLWFPTVTFQLLAESVRASLLPSAYTPLCKGRTHREVQSKGWSQSVIFRVAALKIKEGTSCGKSSFRNWEVVLFPWRPAEDLKTWPQYWKYQILWSVWGIFKVSPITSEEVSSCPNHAGHNSYKLLLGILPVKKNTTAYCIDMQSWESV